MGVFFGWIFGKEIVLNYGETIMFSPNIHDNDFMFPASLPRFQKLQRALKGFLIDDLNEKNCTKSLLMII